MVAIPKDRDEFEEANQISLSLITGIVVVILINGINFISDILKGCIDETLVIITLILCFIGLWLIRDYQNSKKFSKYLRKIKFK